LLTVHINNSKIQISESEGKGKFKLSLFLTKHHAMKTYGGVGVLLHAFITSALDGCEWPTSRPGRFTPGERDSDARWVGGWVGPRAGLDAVVKRKIAQPLLGLELPIIQPLAQRDITELEAVAKIKILSLSLPGIEARFSNPYPSHCTD
jgi:hypothetical protein